MKLLLPLILFAAGAATLGATVTEKFSQTYLLSPTGVVQLDNANGPVEIVGWDKAEVSVEAEKSAPDELYLRLIHLDIDATPDRLTIRTKYEKKGSLFGDSRGEVHYKLRVPFGARLESIDVVNSDLVVRDVRGAVDLRNVNGRIEASGLVGPAKFSSVNGEIRVAFEHLPADGAVSLKTVNGSCRVSVPRDSHFELNSESVNGSVTCSLPITLERSGHRHLRGSVGGGGIEVAMKSVNGSAEVSAN